MSCPIADTQASPLSDMLVFHKVKERLGGRVRLVASGSAPLAAHIEEFLKVTMCAPVIQGYGLTETCGSSFSALPYMVRSHDSVLLSLSLSTHCDHSTTFKLLTLIISHLLPDQLLSHTWWW